MLDLSTPAKSLLPRQIMFTGRRDQEVDSVLAVVPPATSGVGKHGRGKLTTGLFTRRPGFPGSLVASLGPHGASSPPALDSGLSRLLLAWLYPIHFVSGSFPAH